LPQPTIPGARPCRANGGCHPCQLVTSHWILLENSWVCLLFHFGVLICFFVAGLFSSSHRACSSLPGVAPPPHRLAPETQERGLVLDSPRPRPRTDRSILGQLPQQHPPKQTPPTLRVQVAGRTGGGQDGISGHKPPTPPHELAVCTRSRRRIVRVAKHCSRSHRSMFCLRRAHPWIAFKQVRVRPFPPSACSHPSSSWGCRGSAQVVPSCHFGRNPAFPASVDSVQMSPVVGLVIQLKSFCSSGWPARNRVQRVGLHEVRVSLMMNKRRANRYFPWKMLLGKVGDNRRCWYVWLLPHWKRGPQSR